MSSHLYSGTHHVSCRVAPHTMSPVVPYVSPMLRSSSLPFFYACVSAFDVTGVRSISIHSPSTLMVCERFISSIFLSRLENIAAGSIKRSSC